MKDIPIKIKVNADLTEASTELVKGTRSGLGMLVEACLGPRIANVKADAQRAEAQAAVDDQLIRAGLARYENGRVVYLADAAKCARFLACSRDQRRVENLSACLEEAAKAIDKDPIFSLPGKDIDLDFLDDWQDRPSATIPTICVPSGGVSSRVNCNGLEPIPDELWRFFTLFPCRKQNSLQK